MRLKTRNKIIDLISTVIEGIKYIENANEATGLNILNDCFDAVISIFNTLDDILPEDKTSLYAEIISSIIELINLTKENIGDNQQVEKLIRDIKFLLDDLKSNLQHEDEVKLEIIFLPYKASMWDSMESIWIEAKDDPKCNCHVIPIPYHVNTEKNDFSIFEYEGDKFDNGIPITHYNDYDIELEKPDIIYIHNPYDEYNTLTRVPECYFSRNLKKYTDMLVYCPYTIGMGNNIITKKSHIFFKMPGYRYSHRIINQSIHYQKNMINIGFLPNKLIPLGSPKIDYVIHNIKKEKNVIPNEWSKRLNNRKVFLLNTKIFHFSVDGQENADDLSSLIHLIADRPDCALIWRPHPLALSGVRIYEPRLYNEYLQLIEDFKKLENCILDYTPNYALSFCVSDAFISDMSSLAIAYLVTNKPVYLLEGFEMFKDGVNSVELSAFYTQDCGISISDFRNMVLNNKDYNYTNRINILDKAFPNLDGNAGKRIHNQIINEVISLN